MSLLIITLSNKDEPSKTIVVVFLMTLIASCGETKKPLDNLNNVKALELVKQEQKVKEAIITDAKVLYVTVVDDGTRRDGYAEYLCQLLKDNQVTTNWVKIMKVNSSKDPNRDNAYGVLLGGSHCK